MNKRITTHQGLSIISYGKVIASIIIVALPVLSFAIFKMQENYYGNHCKVIERDIASCNQRIERESAMWATLSDSESIDHAIARNGLAMHYPTPAQIVRVSASGIESPSPAILAQVGKIRPLTAKQQFVQMHY